MIVQKLRLTAVLMLFYELQPLQGHFRSYVFRPDNDNLLPGVKVSKLNHGTRGGGKFSNALAILLSYAYGYNVC